MSNQPLNIPGTNVAPQISNASMARAINYMANNFFEEIRLTDVAAATSISKFSLCRGFQKNYGCSPMRWLWELRTYIAREYIALTPTFSLTDISCHCGFPSLAHFSRTFRQVMGETPSQYRSRCKQERKVMRVLRFDFESLANANQVVQQAISKMLSARKA